jgi:hypothetical protein
MSAISKSCVQAEEEAKNDFFSKNGWLEEMKCRKKNSRQCSSRHQHQQWGS